MLNGLDLFSGYGGISLGLKDWVRPIAFCENDIYAQAILLSRMGEGSLTNGPIWDDIRTFKGSEFRGICDIVYGGFPCQDISAAGSGDGLEGERSGLFYELCRVVKEVNPRFVFLENVPAIRTRGLREVIRAFTDLRYDCRWTSVSAAEVGANHLRQRWFLLAHSNDKRREYKHGWGDGKEHREIQAVAGLYGKEESMANSNSTRNNGILADTNSNREEWNEPKNRKGFGTKQSSQEFCDTDKQRLEVGKPSQKTKFPTSLGASWWSTESDIRRVVDGCPFRMERIRALGNGVVPLQVKEAFMRLSGLDGYQEKRKMKSRLRALKSRFGI